MVRLLKYIVLTFLLLMQVGKSHAQSEYLLGRLYEQFSSCCMVLDYSYVTRMSGVKVAGDGLLHVQDGMWRNEGNGVEIWCDGNTVWTVDPVSEEVIIEPVSEEEGSLVNPALLFVKMNDHFNLSKSLNAPDGKSVILVLEPKSDVGIEYFNVEIDASDVSIHGASFALEDGDEVKIKVSSMKGEEKKPATYFRPSQTFDSSWIVTDLR